MSIFDTIWRKRGRPNQHELDEAEEEQTHTITQTDRDYSDLLEYGDVAIKFWLPELMDTILDESCSFFRTSRSDLIRQTLFAYLYGRYDLIGLLERKDCHYELTRPVLFSKRARPAQDSVEEPEPDIMQDMGKNTEDLKVWIPRKMKIDIQVLADKASISLSEMIREIIISMLFGHTYLSVRKELMQMEIEVEDETEN
jgi:hypothetical protein